ncbi:putative CipC-like antibiotic response protein [Pyronema domesticum]|nr:putative CipC-like antibiotic response protein [Pyronema domesticum]
MFGWGESHEAYEQVKNSEGREHEGSFSHELIAGAAAFEAFKAFENHQRREGKTVSHGFAKEALVGLVGAEVDKLVETKGLDYIDREKAKRHAEQGARQMYDEQYGGSDQYDPNQGMHSRLERYF